MKLAGLSGTGAEWIELVHTYLANPCTRPQSLPLLSLEGVTRHLSTLQWVRDCADGCGLRAFDFDSCARPPGPYFRQALQKRQRIMASMDLQTLAARARARGGNVLACISESPASFQSGPCVGLQ